MARRHGPLESHHRRDLDNLRHRLRPAAQRPETGRTKEREKAAALEKENIQPASENTQRDHQLDADDAAFLSAVGTGLILHELHERNKEQERASRDYDGNWDNPDDDS